MYDFLRIIQNIKNSAFLKSGVLVDFTLLICPLLFQEKTAFTESSYHDEKKRFYTGIFIVDFF